MALFLAIGLIAAGVFLTLATRFGARNNQAWAGEFMVEMILVPLVCGLLSSGVLIFCFNV